MAFLASAAPVLAALGVGAQAVGSLESGFYSGQVAKNNAKIATQSANYAHQAGSEEAATEGRKVAAEEAAIKTATGAHGIDVNTGSAADVGVGARETGAIDVSTVLQNANLEAYGYTTKAQEFNAEAQQDETAGIWKAASSILGGASSLGGNWSSITGSGAPSVPPLIGGSS